MSGSGVLKRSPGMFLTSLMIFLSLLLGGAMSVRRNIVQFRRALVVFVM
jgi:hypothetical protein